MHNFECKLALFSAMASMETAKQPKKKLSPYFSFCKHRRDDVKARLKLSGLPVSANHLSKALSELWKSLSDLQKQVYNQQEPLPPAPDSAQDCASIEPENPSLVKIDDPSDGRGEIAEDNPTAFSSGSKDAPVLPEIADPCAEKALSGSVEEQALALPRARVKRIIKLDKEIRVVAADASFLIAYAAQLFLEHLASTAYGATLKKRHKTIRMDHLNDAIISECRVNDFLGDALKEIFATEEESADDESENEDGEEAADASALAQEKSDGSRKRKLNKKTTPAPPVGTRRIADFFSSKPTLPQASSSEAA